MALSKSQWSVGGAALVIAAALAAWLLLKPGLHENYIIPTSIKPDTYIATRLEEAPPENTQPVSPQTGIQDGFGVFSHPDGSIYVGNFINGRSHGRGKITYPGGASYEGEFSDGLPHGQGVCTYSSGESVDCIFAMGERQ
jgi:hypothetical protein